MATRHTVMLLLLISATLWTVSYGLLIIAGVAPLIALVWNVLSSLDINFDLLPAAVANTAPILAASLIDAFVFAIAAVALAALFLDTIKRVDFRRRHVVSKVKRLKGHVILAPYNQFAENICKELSAAGIKCVFLTADEMEAHRLYRKNELVLIGDPKAVDIFRMANIENAKYVIACSNDDLQNALIVVTAKSASAKTKIISRVTAMENIAKLGTAGAFRMIMTEVAAGQEIGEELVRRTAT